MYSTRCRFHKLIYILRPAICALRTTFEKLFTGAKVWRKVQKISVGRKKAYEINPRSANIIKRRDSEARKPKTSEEAHKKLAYIWCVNLVISCIIILIEAEGQSIFCPVHGHCRYSMHDNTICLYRLICND